MFFAGARVSRTQQNQHFPFGGKAHKGCFLGNSHFESTYRSHSIPHLIVGNITFESMRLLIFLKILVAHLVFFARFPRSCEPDLKPENILNCDSEENRNQESGAAR